MSNFLQASDSTRDSSNDALLTSQLNALYETLDPQHVDQFYQGYSAWQMRQRIATLQANLTRLEQQISDNAVLMQLVLPSAISLSALTRLQSYGVDDINLLDTMLERGEEWLDHAMQLLTRCEQLNLIHESYNEWSRHALEGAYDWLDSINETGSPQFTSSSQSATAPPSIETSTFALPTETMASETNVTSDTTGEKTAALLLRKLMNEDETTVNAATPEPDTPSVLEQTETTQHLQQVEVTSLEQEVPSTTIHPSVVQDRGTTLGSSTQKPPGLVSRVLAKIWNVQ